MSAKSKRAILLEYQEEVRNLELSEAAINLLEQVQGRAAQRCIETLKRDQCRMVRRLDAAAGKLGAPYPTLEAPT